MKSKKARSKAPTKRKKRSSLVRRTATRTKARSISVKPKVVRKTRKKAGSARAKIKVKSVSKTRSSSDISNKLRSVRSSSTPAKQQEAPPTKVVATTFSKRTKPVTPEQSQLGVPLSSTPPGASAMPQKAAQSSTQGSKPL